VGAVSVVYKLIITVSVYTYLQFQAGDLSTLNFILWVTSENDSTFNSKQLPFKISSTA